MSAELGLSVSSSSTCVYPDVRSKEECRELAANLSHMCRRDGISKNSVMMRGLSLRRSMVSRGGV